MGCRVRRPILLWSSSVVPTGSVLDARCGTGDNALFFASRGHKVIGIDYLQRAKRKAAEQGSSLFFLVRDATTLKDWWERYCPRIALQPD